MGDALTDAYVNAADKAGPVVKSPGKGIICTSTPQLPFQIAHIPSNRNHKAINRGTLGGLGIYIHIYTWCACIFIYRGII